MGVEDQDGKRRAGSGATGSARSVGSVGSAGATSAAGAAGPAGEARALALLEHHGLRLVERNYRVAGGPNARGGEIDLIVRDRDGTLVFVEVRVRRGSAHGGAAASIGPAKRRSLVFAAERYLMRLPALPPCRFDVVAIDGDRVDWLKAAFDAG